MRNGRCVASIRELIDVRNGRCVASIRELIDGEMVDLRLALENSLM